MDGEVVAGSEPGSAAPQPTGAAPPNSVSFPGTIGSALGGSDWAPDDPAVQATGEGDGVWSLTGELPAGDYEFKAAIDGSWAINYGLGGVKDGPNIPLSLDHPAIVTFRYDAITNAVWAEVAGEVVAGAAPTE